MQTGDEARDAPLITALEDPSALASDLAERAQGALAAALSWSTLWQLGAVAGALALGWLVSRPLLRRARARMDGAGERGAFRQRIDAAMPRILWPAATVVFLWIALLAFRAFGISPYLLRVAAGLLNAWIVARVVAGLASGASATTIAVTAWTLAALYITRLLGPVTDAMRGVAIPIGGSTVTLLAIVSGALLAIVALWIGRALGTAAQAQIQGSKSLNPSIAGLLGQVAKAAILIVAFLFAIRAVGIPLTGLAIFSGALGVGIGFGLQTIFSNFASGVIILLERSVKVGDFIELASGTTGLVREINVRSTLVTTNDNVDILVPNEEFAKSQVINWTLREAGRRLRVPFGVAYGSDKELVRRAGLEAADAVDWTDRRKNKAPQVWLTGFGDSALDFELVVWLIDDAVKKPAKVSADYYWALHTALEKYGIEIPFPQTDLHVRGGDPLRVRIEAEDEATET